MDRSTPIYLISQTYSENEYGVLEPTRTSRKVYANVTSVNMAEWYEGSRNGLNPQYRVVMFKYDYEGEELVEIAGETFAIYRVYQERSDVIDLYCEARKGAEQ